MKLICIILSIVTIVLMGVGTYCYIANVDGCRYDYSSWTGNLREWSIMDNLGDPESFIAGLLWDLGLVFLLATVIMILVYKNKVKNNPELATIRGEARVRKIAKLNAIRAKETIRLIRDCKLYTALVPFYFIFSLFFFLGLVGYCAYPEEDMWIVPIIEVVAGLTFLIVGINLINTSILMKKEINSRNVSEEEFVAAKNAFRNFVAVSIAITVVCSVAMSVAVTSAFESSKSSGDNDYSIYSTAESAVKSQLKAPSSAKFSNRQIVQSSSNTWIVTGTVEAQNSFGVYLSNTYKVVVTRTGPGEYQASSCTIN